MEKILKLFTITLLIGLSGCKPQQQVIHTSSVQDTIISHKTDVVTLPTRSITIIKEPCKDSVLQPINQTITSGGVTATISSNNGAIQIETSTPQVVSSNQDNTNSHTSVEIEEVTITKKVTPKWAWYSLILNAGLLVWTFRKPLISLIKTFLI